MDIKFLIKILNSKEVLDIKKLKYKYPDLDVEELSEILSTGLYDILPIYDFSGRNVCYIKNICEFNDKAIKLLSDKSNKEYISGSRALVDEIASTMAIENIKTNKESVRNILLDKSPAGLTEEQIFGLKKGFEYIYDINNTITEKSINHLYHIAINDYISEENRLPKGEFYRNGPVYIVGSKVEHSGLNYKKLSTYMNQLIEFIKTDINMPDLIKGSIIHFYIGYLHPYFDGNGRMARLIHQWFLIQSGYPATLSYSFSNFINLTRKMYYKSFTQTEENAKLTGVLDVTPFISYFNEAVYSKISKSIYKESTIDIFNESLAQGSITDKERELWYFVLAVYGEKEFTTKQLEKDFKNAAYATIRSFVIKFKELKLLDAQNLGNKVKYRVHI